jgi:hypothetical protein
MKGKTATIIFLGVCLLLAGMLILKAFTFMLGGIVFAVVLVTLGLLSNSFRKK